MNKDFFGQLSQSAKIALLVGVVLIAVFALTFYQWASAKEYGVLYADLSEQDAGKVKTYLDDEKLDYQLGEGGQTILVNNQDLDAIRLNIADSDLPVFGGKGFELFDDADYGMTEFVQNINFQRAMQGELARTISALVEVKSTRVHLVLPKETLFQREKQKPKASVSLTLHDNKFLVDSQIVGIQNLIASSIEEMNVDNVLVFDQSGRLLSEDAQDKKVTMGANFEYKKELESYLADKASQVLKPIFGKEGSFVFVDADVDFNEVNIVQETYKPAGKDKQGLIVKSKVTTSSEGKGSSRNAKNKGAQQSSAEYEYKHTKSIEQIVQSKGGIKRLTVSVLLPEGVSEEQSNAVKHLVSATIGVDLERGDIISVEGLAFQAVKKMPSNFPSKVIVPKRDVVVESEIVESAGSMYLPSSIVAHLPKLFLALLLLCVILVVFLVVNSQKKSPVVEKMTDEQRRKTLSDIQKWLES